MRIAIVGAGALGSLFACLLKESGQDVTLVERNRKTIRVIRSKGIWLVDPEGVERNVRVPITLGPRLEGAVDVLLLFVKTYDTRAAVNCTNHVVGPETYVGSFQNGVGNMEVIGEVVAKERIFCGSLPYSSMPLAENRIRFSGGSGALRLAKFDNVNEPGFLEVAEVFKQTGFPVEVVKDSEASLWNKLLMNAAANPLSAITGLSCREMLEDQHLQEIMSLAVREVAAVASAKGLAIDEANDPVRPLFRALQGIGPNKTTMLQDLERRGKTEIDSINGAVIREADRLGLSVPVNRLLFHLVQSLERRTLLTQAPHSSSGGAGTSSSYAVPAMRPPSTQRVDAEAKR
ncbi:MAG: ketopantoate reductase family protein [Nitrospiraceae bacterium]|nr:ketopantoate reductase family protein [Nitrospiraceae bacterium]